MLRCLEPDDAAGQQVGVVDRRRWRVAVVSRTAYVDVYLIVITHSADALLAVVRGVRGVCAPQTLLVPLDVLGHALPWPNGAIAVVDVADQNEAMAPLGPQCPPGCAPGRTSGTAHCGRRAACRCGVPLVEGAAGTCKPIRNPRCRCCSGGLESRAALLRTAAATAAVLGTSVARVVRQ